MLWIAEIGTLLLCLAFAFSLVFALRLTLNPTQWKKHWGILFLVLIGGGFSTLALSLLELDFSVRYVVMHAHTGLPWYYRLTAAWGGYEGSWLLWMVTSSLWMTIFIRNPHIPAPFMGQALKVLLWVQSALLLFILLGANPFLRTLPEMITQGQDLNPVLQDFGLIIHPPILYMGLVGLSIPFAAAYAGIKTATMPLVFYVWIRSYLLAIVGLLTLGVGLGSWWAYYELGWGGWWFWDPVENLSLIPWLWMVAMVHVNFSARFTQALTLFGFPLVLLGVVLVRSGAVSSIHAFANDPVRGTYLAAGLAVLVLWMLIVYLQDLRLHTWATPKKGKRGMREGVILLLILAAAILLGTLYPLTGSTITVGVGYFNGVFVPLWGAIVLFATVVPWQKLPDAEQRSVFYQAFGISLVLGAIALWQCQYWTTSIGVVGGALLIFYTLFAAWHYEGGLTKKAGLLCAHLGVGLLTVAMSVSTDLQREYEVVLHIGQTQTLGTDTYTLQGLQTVTGGNFVGTRATLAIRTAEGVKSTLQPEKRFFEARGVAVSETAIVPGIFRDVYVAMGESLGPEQWSFKIQTKPMVRWIWGSAILIALGAGLAARRRRVGVMKS